MASTPTATFYESAHPPSFSKEGDTLTINFTDESLIVSIAIKPATVDSIWDGIDMRFVVSNQNDYWDLLARYKKVDAPDVIIEDLGDGRSSLTGRWNMDFLCSDIFLRGLISQEGHSDLASILLENYDWKNQEPTKSIFSIIRPRKPSQP